ncbi:sulfatase-like hydrolase/transferase, partial [Actinomadura adrarensis]
MILLEPPPSAMNWTPTVHRRHRHALGMPTLLALVVGCTPAQPATSPPVPSASPAHSASPVPSPTGPPPNFVLLMADDLDETLMPYMPRVKRLLTDQGTSLSRYYVNIPWCCPSRVTTLRGQYAHNTGVFSVNPPDGGYVEFYERGEERSTLATWLQSAGYRTGLFGKYLNGFPHQVPKLPLDYVPPGWNSWVTPVKGAPFSGFNYTLSMNGRLVQRPPTADNYLTDVLAREAEKFVSAKDERPFFAFVTPLMPHLPAVPAPRHAGMFPDLKAPRTPNFDPPDAA